jgi:predicted nucleic acid-binding Zn finger protein
MVATQVLAKVEGQRLQKAVEGLVRGAYRITVVLQSEAEVRGFVANGDGKEYGVVLSKGQGFCSCKDAIYRKSICKHAVALALYVIRNPEPQSEAEEEATATKPVNLKLTKTRPGFAFAY